MRPLGPHQRRLLAFVINYPGWHSAAPDRLTRRTVRSLAKRGLLVTNEHSQFRRPAD